MPIPSALTNLEPILARVRGRPPAVFLDFDGTLAPIVERPELAEIDAGMRAIVERLARRCAVAVVSGRDREDVARRVALERVYYAGSHGFDIGGPHGTRHEHPQGIEALPALDAAEQELRASLQGVAGALVERKRFSVAVHYRRVSDHDAPAVERAVDDALRRRKDLRKGTGKKVFELQPDVQWDKGAAVHWLLRALGLDRPDVLPVYIGDDVTDEDAFRALAGRGLCIAVLDHARPTAAEFSLDDPQQVRVFLHALAAALEAAG